MIMLAYEGKKSEEIAEIVKHEEMVEIDAALKKSPKAAGMEVANCRGKILVEYVKKRFDKTIKIGTAYKIFHRLRYSKTRAKKQNKKRNAEEAEEFREKLKKIIESKDENTIILYGDEAIFTSEPTANSVWTKVGEQPIVETGSGTRKRTVVFGAVNPENGDFFKQFSPAGDTENFQSFLSLISSLTSDKNVILLQDNATYHHFKGIAAWLLEKVSNISIIYFPSHCSDLNSIELLWKDTRTNVTHNTLFDVFDDLVSSLRDYFDNLKFFTNKLMKLCHFIY